MDRWMEAPPAPNRCHRTSKDAPDQGPYFVESFAYAQVRNGPDGLRPGKVEQLVHAASWIKTICDSPGSPYVLFDIDEAAQREAELDDLRERVADLELQLEEANAGPIDTAALTDNIVSILDARYAKKPGPKAAA